ncbi:MAG: hypothetical protein JW774_01935 [Candidatus Aureabacteria bacterium]|nr:hypothetical protein [Candidatus Auribacterota bacterium]
MKGGYRMQHPDTKTNASNADVEPKVPWYYNKWAVWVMLLSVGPFGIPFLVLSPKFNWASKILISLMMITITILPLYLGFEAVHYIKSDQFQHLVNTLPPEQKDLIEQLLALLK